MNSGEINRVNNSINSYQYQIWNREDARKGKPFGSTLLRGVFAELFIQDDIFTVKFEHYLGCTITTLVKEISTGYRSPIEDVIKEIKSILDKPDPILQGAPADVFMMGDNLHFLYFRLLGTQNNVNLSINLNDAQIKFPAEPPRDHGNGNKE